jgi:hypothetical protein
VKTLQTRSTKTIAMDLSGINAPFTPKTYFKRIRFDRTG